MRRLACVLFVVGSCSTPERAPRAVHATTVPSSDPLPTEPARAAPTPSATRPRVVEVIRPVIAPWPTDAIYVDEVVDDFRVALFPDERAAIRARVAQWLEQRGESVIPLATLEGIERDAMAGVLTLEAGRRCRAPMHRREVRTRWFASHPRAFIDAQCANDAGCVLHIVIEGPGDESRGWNSAVVRRPEDPKAWLAAVRSLRPIELEGHGLGLMGTGGPPPPIVFEPPQGVGPWAKAPDHALLSDREPTAAVCAHPDPVVGMAWEMRLAIDRSGRVRRCDATTDSVHGRAIDATCLCDALDPVVFPRGAAGRRLRLRATDDGDTSTNDARFVLVQPGTEPWIERLQQSPVLRRCLAVATPRMSITFPVELALADDGTITDVHLGGDVSSIDRMRFATCIVDVLKATALPCAPPGITTLHAEIRLGAP